MLAYFGAVFAGAMSVIVVYAGALTVIDRGYPDRMPTPALSGVVPTDEKLRFLRERRADDLTSPPDLLAVGSSITWMHLDGSAFDGPDTRFLNGGTAHLRINQIRAMSDFYLDLYTGVSRVIMVTAITDFRDCSNVPDWVLDRKDAENYVNRTRPTASFFLQYFAPGRYFRQVVSRDETLQPYELSSYWLDPWGTTPVLHDEIQPGYDLRYGEITPDPACFKALEQMARDLKDRGVDFHIVLSPVNPRYAKMHPSSRSGAARIARTAESVGASLTDLNGDPRFSSHDFRDAFHLQWPAAQRMSSIVAKDLPEPRPQRATDARHIAIQNDG